MECEHVFSMHLKSQYRNNDSKKAIYDAEEPAALCYRRNIAITWKIFKLMQMRYVAGLNCNLYYTSTSYTLNDCNIKVVMFFTQYIPEYVIHDRQTSVLQTNFFFCPRFNLHVIFKQKVLKLLVYIANKIRKATSVKSFKLKLFNHFYLAKRPIPAIFIVINSEPYLQFLNIAV